MDKTRVFLAHGVEPSPEILAGGRTTAGVVRIGETVHRPPSPRAPFVHDLLRHLERASFAGAPRWLGFDPDGREVLTYHAGDVPHHGEQGKWNDRQLCSAAGLLASFHAATAGSELAAGAEVVCHNDFAPWNVVFVNQLPTVIIDFDEAAPGPRLRDFAYAVWCWLTLGSAELPVDEQARRIRLMSDAYGLGSRCGLLGAVSQRQEEILRQHIERGWASQARRVAAEIDWLRIHRAVLDDLLT